MADSPEEIQKHLRTYLYVFYALIVGTLITVGAYLYIDLGGEGFSVGDAVLGLMIATAKASLVCLFFMHLNHEKSLIYKFLVFTFFFFLGLMFLSLFALWNPIQEILGVQG
ncbi:MAG: cytochrome C oxidase subunit IV family protein [Verrucomicrobiota bacterium]